MRSVVEGGRASRGEGLERLKARGKAQNDQQAGQPEAPSRCAARADPEDGEA